MTARAYVGWCLLIFIVGTLAIWSVPGGFPR